MSTLSAAQTLAAELDQLGVRATVDPADLVGQLPAVLVLPPQVTPGTYSGAELTWTLMACALSAEPLTAWAELDGIAATITEHTDWEMITPTTWTLPDGRAAAALEVTLTTMTNITT